MKSARATTAGAITAGPTTHAHRPQFAMRAYAKQAKNKQLEIDAAEIRIRAERRVGELMQAQRDSVGLASGTKSQLKGRDSSGGTVAVPPESLPTLAEAGIDKHLADRARKLAALPAQEFEQLVDNWRDRTLAEQARVRVETSE